MHLPQRGLAVIGAVTVILGASMAASAVQATTTMALATWAAIKAPLPANADHTYAELYGAACRSASVCTAVGSYTGSAGMQGLLLTKSGTTWAATQAPLPAGAAADPYASLQSINCISTSACAGTGTYTDTMGDTQNLLLTGSGSSWTAAEAPLPPGTAPSTMYLSAVKCASATSCLAVGYGSQAATGNSQAVLLTGFGSDWTAVPVPLPANAVPANGYSLWSVACTSPSVCIAVGDYSTAKATEGLIETGSGASWTATEAPLPANASPYPEATLTAVRCGSTSQCTAAGNYVADSGDAGLLLTGAGTTWTATTAPLPSNAGGNYVYFGAMDCPYASPCTAIGAYKAGDLLEGLIVAGSQSTWTASQAPLPGNAAKQQLGTPLTRVSCTSANACVIGGSYTTATGNQAALLILGSGTSWSTSQPPIPGDAANASIGDVACVKAACLAVGYYRNRAGNDQALLLTGPP